MNGKTVGITRGTILSELLQQWCEKKKVNLKIVEYEEISKKEEDLYAGKIDLDLELSMLAKRNLSAVEKVGASAYYLVAGKNRPDLIDDINSAQEKVINNDLFYFSRLQERYFSNTVLSRNLTIEEKKWIENHKVLRVGFFDNYLPFCTMDENGKPIGAGIDVINEIVNQLKLKNKLKVEFICYKDQKAGYEAVESGEIDLMIPAYISKSVQHDYRIIGGKTLAAMAIDLAYLDHYQESKNQRIGVNKDNLMQHYYTKDTYPNAKIVLYDNIRDCLDGLLDRTSDATLLNGHRSESLLKPGKYHAVRMVRVKRDFQFRMAFAENNIGLMVMMNRGLTLIDSDFMNKATYSYVGQIYKMSMMDFLRDHILSVLISVAILVALLVALLGYVISNRKLAGINRELRKYSATVERQRQQLEKKQNELEDALQLAQAASHAKTTFLSNMSHDIRTPMNAIIGFTGLAASHISDQERVQDYLTTIARSSEHLLSLINDVLDMSRIEAGKMTINKKLESLADIFHALRDIVHADIQAKQHKFFIDAVNVRDERVYCDKMRLNQVLLNLVSNAIKYTHEGGTISLRLTQTPSEKPGYATFEFRCKDNGIGMSEDFAKTIFDPFTREENSTVSGIQGTGLGMAITKNIVDMMGGKISFTTKKGIGTEFVVTLEFRTAGSETADLVIPELKEARCLVVNSDAVLGSFISDILRHAGMHCICCTSYEEAAVLAEGAFRSGDLFKVCIVDRITPDLNPIETVRTIRKAAGEKAFIILTAYDWFDIEKEAREAGVTGFIKKPLFTSDLYRTLLHACGRTYPEPADEKVPVISFQGKKILMVDDSTLNLKIGVLLLQEQGMIVDTASNGQIAVDMIREKGVDAYDFVLMDVQMPVMDGYTATSLIRKLPNGSKLKIIAFSANAFEEDKEKSLKAGMNGHIAKPLKIDELLNELKLFVD